MADFITLVNCAPGFDKAWVKAKKKEIEDWELETLEALMPKATNKEKAKKLGLTYNQYMVRRYRNGKYKKEKAELESTN